MSSASCCCQPRSRRAALCTQIPPLGKLLKKRQKRDLGPAQLHLTCRAYLLAFSVVLAVTAAFLVALVFLSFLTGEQVFSAFVAAGAGLAAGVAAKAGADARPITAAIISEVIFDMVKFLIANQLFSQEQVLRVAYLLHNFMLTCGPWRICGRTEKSLQNPCKAHLTMTLRTSDQIALKYSTFGLHHTWLQYGKNTCC